jgi:hypothetical protein
MLELTFLIVLSPAVSKQASFSQSSPDATLRRCLLPNRQFHHFLADSWSGAVQVIIIQDNGRDVFTGVMGRGTLRMI